MSCHAARQPAIDSRNEQDAGLRDIVPRQLRQLAIEILKRQVHANPRRVLPEQPLYVGNVGIDGSLDVRHAPPRRAGAGQPAPYVD